MATDINLDIVVVSCHNELRRRGYVFRPGVLEAALQAARFDLDKAPKHERAREDAVVAAIERVFPNYIERIDGD